MATFENSVIIRRPIKDVFAFLSDFGTIPKWNSPSSRPTRCLRAPQD